MASCPALGQDDASDDVLPPPFIITAETAAEHIETALLMLRIGREDVARQQIGEALATSPSGAELRAIRRDVGSGRLLQMARNEALLPESQELLDATNSAVAAFDATDEAIEELLDNLQETGDAGQNAELDARRMGVPLATKLMNRAAMASDAERAAIVRGLTAIGPASTDALLAARTSDDASVQSVLSEVLPAVATRDHIADLIALEGDPDLPAPARQAAARALDRLNVPQQRLRAGKTLRDAIIARLVNTSRGRVLRWDDSVKTLELTPVENVGLAAAKPLIESAGRISPDSAEIAVLARLLNGEYDNAKLTDLETAIRLELREPAIAILNELERTDAVFDASSPLVAALNSPSRAIQLAAAAAAVRLGPDNIFPRSSRVAEILVANAIAGDRPRAVVADPDGGRASETAGKFSGYGFDATTVLTGRDAITAAAATGDVELIVVNPNIYQNSLSFLLAELAADARTAEIPVIILTKEGGLAAARIAARNHRQAVVIEDAIDVRYLERQVRPFLTGVATSDAIAQRRSIAMDSLASIGRSDSLAELFPLNQYGTVLTNLAFGVGGSETLAVADVLSAIGTPSAAEALIDLSKAAPAVLRTEVNDAIERHKGRYPSLR